LRPFAVSAQDLPQNFKFDLAETNVLGRTNVLPW